MSTKTLDVKEYPETAHLMREVEATFQLGYDVVELVDAERTVCWILKALSNRTVEAASIGPHG